MPPVRPPSAGPPAGAHAGIIARVSTSARWAFVESLIGAGASLLTVLVLARRLPPDEFGRAGIAVAVALIVQTALIGGMPDALVRAPSAHTKLSDALFWTLTAFGLAIAAVIAGVGGATAAVTSDARLGALIAVQGLGTIAFAAAAVPTGLLLRKLRTRALANRTAVSKLAGLCVTVSLALAGYGAWAIVIGGVSAQAIGTAQLLATMRRPRWRRHDPMLGETLRIGIMTGAQQSLGTLSTRGFILAFGAAFGAYQVGLFNFALRLVEESCGLVITTLRRVTVTSFAAAKRRGLDLRPLFLSGTNVIAYGTAPLFLGGAAVAPDAVALLFGSQWAAAVPALQLMLAMWVVRATRILVNALMVVAGRQAAMVGFGLVGLVATAAAFMLLAPHGPAAATFAYAATLIGVVFAGPAFARQTGIGISAQLGAGAVPIALAVAMAVAVTALRLGPLAGLPLPWRLVAQIAAGALLFTTAALVVDPAGLGRLRRLARR